jgi:hypothetical protein
MSPVSAVLAIALAVGFTACGRIWYTPVLAVTDAGQDREGGTTDGSGGAGGDGAGGLDGDGAEAVADADARPTDAGGTTGAGGMDGGSEVGGAGADGGTSDAAVDVGAGAPCATGSYSGHLYAFCDGPLDWSTAEADCERKGMHLVRIDDAQENAFIEASAFAGVPAGSNSMTVWRWLGANDQATTGEWRWTDGTLFWLGGSKGMLQPGLYANWANNQPNSAGGLGNHCGAVEHDATIDWTDEACANVQPYICEQ